jgi:hypothetical protein
LFDFAAIGVVNAITKIDIGPPRRFDNQYLIATDTEVAIGQLAYMTLFQHDALADQVEHDKIIAAPVHFGKA